MNENINKKRKDTVDPRYGGGRGVVGKRHRQTQRNLGRVQSERDPEPGHVRRAGAMMRGQETRRLERPEG